MTDLLHETATHWTDAFRNGGVLERFLILYMLVIAPALTVAPVVRHFF